MDVLRNLFGNLSAGIIRLLVTVGILAAVYFFIVKPALSTTEKLGHEVNANVQKGFEQADMGEIDNTIDDVNRQVQIEIRKSFHTSKRQGDADKLIRCIQRAHQNVHRIQRCSNRFREAQSCVATEQGGDDHAPAPMSAIEASAVDLSKRWLRSSRSADRSARSARRSARSARHLASRRRSPGSTFPLSVVQALVGPRFPRAHHHCHEHSVTFCLHETRR